MAGPLYGRDMERLAVERQREGLLLQRQHYEESGICVACGRISPCDSFTEGVEMVARYAAFLNAQPDPTPPANLLVRPYVSPLNGAAGPVGLLNGGRW